MVPSGGEAAPQRAGWLRFVHDHVAVRPGRPGDERLGLVDQGGIAGRPPLAGNRTRRQHPLLLFRQQALSGPRQGRPAVS